MGRSSYGRWEICPATGVPRPDLLFRVNGAIRQGIGAFAADSGVLGLVGRRKKLKGRAAAQLTTQQASATEHNNKIDSLFFSIRGRTMAITNGTRGNSGGHDKVAPIPNWVHAVAMHAEKNNRAVMESKPQLPEDFLATDFDFGRVRALSSQI